MTLYVAQDRYKRMNLQATLSQATSDAALTGDLIGNQLHHPITCSSELYVDEDNTIRCSHCTAPPSNPRNQALFDTSIAILLFQEVAKKYGD